MSEVIGTEQRNVEARLCWWWRYCSEVDTRNVGQHSSAQPSDGTEDSQPGRDNQISFSQFDVYINQARDVTYSCEWCEVWPALGGRGREGGREEEEGIIDIGTVGGDE